MANLKHTREYADNLGAEYQATFNPKNGTEAEDFSNGYMRAIEKTNVTELLRALSRIQYAVNSGAVKGLFEDEISLMNTAIENATK